MKPSILTSAGLQDDGKSSDFEDDGTYRSRKSKKFARFAWRPQKSRIKLKGIWRETQLAQPKMPQNKYIPPYNGPLRLIQKLIQIEPDILERCEQLARPRIRTLTDNKIMFQEVLSARKIKNIRKYEEKTLDSIYNLYLKHRMDMIKRKQKLEAKKMLMAKTSRKTIKETKEQRYLRIIKLATPKKVFPPSKLPKRKHRSLDRMHFEELAMPVQRDTLPPRPPQWPVSPGAKKYVATDLIHHLAEQPRRFEDILPPLQCERPVSRAALKYNITPETLKLYVVKIRKDGVDSDADAKQWKVSEKALKYKPTPRILELSRPIDRP